uniref:Methyltransferase domain-containing protein n=1 Tax=Lygus hesperus TaxID=30085 RepID=A0A0A9YK36_LYGHE
MKLASSMTVSGNELGISYKVKDFKEHLVSLGFDSSSGLNFDKFMCLKKTHEVEAMSDIVGLISGFTGVEHIVDVGDGKGYLSSILALENKLRVLGIDASPTNSAGAAKRVEKMKKHWKGVRRKMNNVDDDKLDTEHVVYQQHTQMVDQDTDLTRIVNEYFPEHASRLGIVGLHTCGSLSPTCLKHFVQNPALRFIVNVGCCYHLIENGDFPMSDHLSRLNYTLSRNARMLSLQPIDRIVQSERVQSDPLMYRAVFEHMMDHVFNLKGIIKPDVGRISSKCSNFVQYVRKACSKLNLPLSMTDEEIQMYYKEMHCHEAKMQFYFLLRLTVAPVIENLILLDRQLYLLENGYPHSYMVELFDSVISPRNYGIISIKLSNDSSER